MASTRRVAVALALVMFAAPARAQLVNRPAARCQDAIGKGGAKFKKILIAVSSFCYGNLLKGGSCDTAARDARIAAALDHFGIVVRRSCTPAQLFSPPPDGLGFAQSCVLEPGTPEPAEQTCAALPVIDGETFGRCLACWKQAEVNEMFKIAFPCVASQIPAGSDLDCGTAPSCPTDKRAIACTGKLAKIALKFVRFREGLNERCLSKVVRGRIPGPCPDAKAAEKIMHFQLKLTATALRCDAAPPWWDLCPEMCSQTITTLDDIAACLNGSAQAIADELVCFQYPSAGTNGLTCPPADEL